MLHYPLLTGNFKRIQTHLNSFLRRVFHVIPIQTGSLYEIIAGSNAKSLFGDV